jgi:hypothetical protein
MIRSWTAALLSWMVGCSMVPSSSPAGDRILRYAGARNGFAAVLEVPESGRMDAPCPALTPFAARRGRGLEIGAEPGVGAEPSMATPRHESGEYRFPSGRERLKDWAVSAFGPFAVAGSAATAAWGQWVSNEPPEWPGDGNGFAKRFGVASATTAITETSFSLLSAATHQDARYYRCPCTGRGPRLVHALKMTFMARRPDGTAVFSVAKTVSPFVGPLMTRTTLYPDRYTYGDGALSGVYALLMNAGWNLAHEFVLKAARW